MSSSSILKSSKRVSLKDFFDEKPPLRKTNKSARAFSLVANKACCLSENLTKLTPTGKTSLESLYLNHPQLLNSFAVHFKRELNPILIQMEPEANNLQELKGKDYFSNQFVCPEIPSKVRQAYYRDLGIGCEAEKAEMLSQRERQCLKLLLQGKSSKETAAALKLSPRTIESYFENIKNKLSCWSKNEVFQAAKRFDELGMLQ
jgi:DNA-binding CsgD family transcriptional regulator